MARWAEKCIIEQNVSFVSVALSQMLSGPRLIRWPNIPNYLLSGMTPAYHDLLDLAANPPGTSCFCRPDEFYDLLREWLLAYGLDPMSVQVAGKNFAAFDMQFLYRLPNFTKAVKFRHRVLDPSMLYWQPGDTRLPDTKTCMERAGIDGTVAHTALEDALAVVRLLRRGISRLSISQKSSEPSGTV